MNDMQKDKNTKTLGGDIMEMRSSFDVTPSVSGVQKLYDGYTVMKRNGAVSQLDISLIRQAIVWASKGHKDVVDINAIVEETLKNSFNGIGAREFEDAQVLATIAFMERDPAYGYVAAQLLFKKLFKDVTGVSVMSAEASAAYRRAFVESIHKGVQAEILDKRMLSFDLEMLAQELCLESDHLLDYMGLKTLYERYFTRVNNKHLELPQIFWMRIAMGLAIQEPNNNQRAIEFYHLMSSLRYVPSTPTLLHAGMVRAQLSSCFLSTVEDNLRHIFKSIGDNAQLMKWSGGVANDWTYVRATGAMVNSIKTESQGVIPFLKIASDTTASINRSGSRRGASVVYLETWHLDVEDFLDLRRNTGDERRRTHDINTANWIPDLFMKRVMNNEDWSLFSPEEVPDLHDLYGKAFEVRYKEYEVLASRGQITKYKKISAQALWRKMLSRLFETGHPWMTFKDACNIRSPQDHAGVVHSSNLCTEITLNTSKDETAVCNLGSVNLGRHVVDGVLDEQMLGQTVEKAVRMLDNVIDINFYPIIEAQNANLRHRPIGLGLMGFQDALYKLDIAFDDPQALEFSDEIMERVSYHAILASSRLAAERGTYESYKGSKWDRNLLPQDTIALLEQERGMPIDIKKDGKLDWSPVREHIKAHGMRNSNTMAIAPTATISNISGCYPCIEPIYKNIYVKANMSGEFTVVNKFLIEDLKKLGIWDTRMLEELKYFDGSVQQITRIPANIKAKYKEAFELDPEWLLHLTAVRSKWIDQSQSHNVFMKGVSGKLMNDIYMTAWRLGLKCTYYLRTLGATQIEKSTLDAKKYGYTQKRQYDSQEEAAVTTAAQEPAIEMAPASAEQVEGKACSISADPECEVCQ